MAKPLSGLIKVRYWQFGKAFTPCCTSMDVSRTQKTKIDANKKTIMKVVRAANGQSANLEAHWASENIDPNNSFFGWNGREHEPTFKNVYDLNPLSGSKVTVVGISLTKVGLIPKRSMNGKAFAFAEHFLCQTYGWCSRCCDNLPAHKLALIEPTGWCQCPGIYHPFSDLSDTMAVTTKSFFTSVLPRHLKRLQDKALSSIVKR